MTTKINQLEARVPAPASGNYQQVDLCNLCGSSTFSHQCPAEDRLYGIPGKFEILECAGCGLWAINPVPVGETLARFYPESYAPYCAVTWDASGWRAKLRAFPLLRNLFQLRDQLRDFFENEKLPASVGRRITPGSFIMDVGCGSGAFLQKMKIRYGCAVAGVDFSPVAAQAVQNMYGIPVHVGRFTEVNLEPASVDVLTGWYYLEHDPDPRAVIRKAYEVLKPGGSVLFGVPNARSVVAWLFGRHWYAIDAPRHLHIFTPATLRRYLEESGFTVRNIYHDRTPWHLLGSLEMFLKPGKVFTPQWPWVRPLRLLFTPVTLLISFLQLSDIIVIWAEKK